VVAVPVMVTMMFLTMRRSIMAGVHAVAGASDHGLAGDRDDCGHRRRDGVVVGGIIKTAADG
jgi:hypothetical protein